MVVDTGLLVILADVANAHLPKMKILKFEDESTDFGKTLLSYKFTYLTHHFYEDLMNSTLRTVGNKKVKKKRLSTS